MRGKSCLCGDADSERVRMMFHGRESLKSSQDEVCSPPTFDQGIVNRPQQEAERNGQHQSGHQEAGRWIHRASFVLQKLFKNGRVESMQLLHDSGQDATPVPQSRGPTLVHLTKAGKRAVLNHPVRTNVRTLVRRKCSISAATSADRAHRTLAQFLFVWPDSTAEDSHDRALGP